MTTEHTQPNRERTQTRAVGALLCLMALLLGSLALTTPASAEPADCGDAIDNDGDGLTDYPEDPGCTEAQDNDETDPAPECSDGIDNDGDGAADFPEDTACDSPDDGAEGYYCPYAYSTSASSSSSCFAANLTIRFDPERSVFAGKVAVARRDCKRGAEVVVRERRPGKDIALGSVLSGRRGVWRLPISGPLRGNFYAKALPHEVLSSSGVLFTCPGDRSVTIRVRYRG